MNIFKKLLWLPTMFFLLVSCDQNKGGGSSKQNSPTNVSAVESTVTLDFNLASFYQNTVKRSGKLPNSPAQARHLESVASEVQCDGTFQAEDLLVGELRITNLDTGEEEVQNWSAQVSAATRCARSNKSIVISPGNYHFELMVGDEDRYFGGEVDAVILDIGTNVVPMTLYAILGHSTTQVNALGELSSLILRYQENEFPELLNPQIGVVIDGGDEELLDIDFSTEEIELFIALGPGAHSVALRLYDSGILVAISGPPVELGPVEEVRVDLIPLHSELAVVVDGQTSSGTFTFRIPDVLLDLVGSLAELEVGLQMAGPLESLPLSAILDFVDTPRGLEAQIEIPDLVFASLTASLTFNRILSSGDRELLGRCNHPIPLSSAGREFTVLCELGVSDPRVIDTGVLGTVGINLSDQFDNPIEGASIFIDDTLVGLTGGVVFGTPGFFVKSLLTAGPDTQYDLRIEHFNAKNGPIIAQFTLSPGELKNLFFEMELKPVLEGDIVPLEGANLVDGEENSFDSHYRCGPGYSFLQVLDHTLLNVDQSDMIIDDEAGEFTVAFWMRVDDETPDNAIVLGGVSEEGTGVGDAQYGFLLKLATGPAGERFIVPHFNGVDGQYEGSGIGQDIGDGGWHYITVTVDPHLHHEDSDPNHEDNHRKIRIFIDGEKNGLDGDDLDANLQNTESLVVVEDGLRFCNDFDGADQLTGNIAEIKFIADKLSDSEAENLFDETDEPSLLIIPKNEAQLISGVYGSPDSHYRCPVTDSKLEVSDGGVFNRGDEATIAFWMKTDHRDWFNPNNASPLHGAGLLSGAKDGIIHNEVLLFMVPNNGSTHLTLHVHNQNLGSGIHDVGNDNWHHVILTRASNGDFTTYVDGLLDRSYPNALDGTALDVAMNGLMFCNDQTTPGDDGDPFQQFLGDIAQIDFLDQSMNASEARNYYRSQEQPDTLGDDIPIQLVDIPPSSFPGGVVESYRADVTAGEDGEMESFYQCNEWDYVSSWISPNGRASYLRLTPSLEPLFEGVGVTLSFWLSTTQSTRAGLFSGTSLYPNEFNIFMNRSGFVELWSKGSFLGSGQTAINDGVLHNVVVARKTMVFQSDSSCNSDSSSQHVNCVTQRLDLYVDGVLDGSFEETHVNNYRGSNLDVDANVIFLCNAQTTVDGRLRPVNQFVGIIGRINVMGEFLDGSSITRSVLP